MNQRLQKGFTLIELLVVIAIIGILAGVVLTSLGSARQKGQDAAVKSQLDSARSAAELNASNNSNSYATTCANLSAVLAGAASPTGATVGVTAAVQTATTVYCNNNATTWVIQAPMSNSVHWCVDSTGASKQEAALAAANATACV